MCLQQRQQYPRGLHESMSASTLHLGSVQIHYPLARLFRNAQGYGAHLPHIMKTHTRRHSPQRGLQQTEARKLFELLATHQFQKQNSG